MSLKADKIRSYIYTIQVTDTAESIGVDQSVPAEKSILLKALSTNTENVWSGGSDVNDTTAGYELTPGEPVWYDVNNWNEVYVYGTAGQKVCITSEKEAGT